MISGNEAHSTQNVLLSKSENVPIRKVVLRRRKNISQEEISDFTAGKGISGITLTDVMRQYTCNKIGAQRTLKYFHSRKILFTAQDLISEGVDLPSTFRNSHPQVYYASSIKAGIIDRAKANHKKVLLSATGTQYSAAPLFRCLESQKGSCFLELLQLIPFQTTYIHKINLELSIPRNCYDEIDLTPLSRERGVEENIGNSHVTYRYHANGTVQVFVACSKFPYKLEEDSDIDNLYSVFGRIKDRISSHLFDARDQIIPSIERWILKQCDINVDIGISAAAQLYLPDIQLKTAGHVFRMYVKSLQEKAVYRMEDSKEVNSALMSSLFAIAHPNHNNEDKIDKMSSQLKDISNRLNPVTTMKISTPWFLTIF